MAVKGTHVKRPLDRPSVYPAAEQNGKPSFNSYWIEGFLILMVVALTFTIFDAATRPLDPVDVEAGAPMVLPEGSLTPGSKFDDGRAGAIDSIAGISKSANSAQAATIDSRVTKPDTNGLPGRDDRLPQPVPAPL